MGFFKKAQVPRFRRNSSNQKPATDGAESSIGSQLAPADQFDIIVRKKGAKGWQLFEKDDSTVSSITTDDRRLYRFHSGYYGSPRRTGVSSIATSMCCCTGKTEGTVETENTLLHNDDGKTDQATNGFCCFNRPHRPSLETPDDELMLSRTRTKDLASLFDNLSDTDGDQDDLKNNIDQQGMSSSKRKWPSFKVPKRLSWKKKAKE